MASAIASSSKLPSMTAMATRALPARAGGMATSRTSASISSALAGALITRMLPMSSPASPSCASMALPTSESTPTSSSSSSSSSLLSSLESFCQEHFPAILLAVPKSKISHSRKSMRSANKGLKDRSNIAHCPACGSPKLSHHLCPTCYSQITRRWKQDARAAQQSAAAQQQQQQQ